LLAVLFEEVVDGGLEVGDGSEDAALEPRLGECREEAFKGIDIEPNDVAQFGDEARIVGKLELADSVRLKSVGARCPGPNSRCPPDGGPSH
jgi:hypothetical protein